MFSEKIDPLFLRLKNSKEKEVEKHLLKVLKALLITDICWNTGGHSEYIDSHESYGFPYSFTVSKERLNKPPYGHKYTFAVKDKNDGLASIFSFIYVDVYLNSDRHCVQIKKKEIRDKTIRYLLPSLFEKAKIETYIRQAEFRIGHHSEQSPCLVVC